MQSKSPRRHPDQPPALAEWLLLRFTPADERDSLAGDLAEEFARYHLPLAGRRAARRWYRAQVARSLVPGLRRPSRADAHRRRLHGLPGDKSMRDLWSDVRYGLRGLVRAPGFSLLTVVTLTLAIGVNSAIFSMVSAIFLAELPIDDTATVGFVRTRNPTRGSERGSLSLAEFHAVRDEVDAYVDVTALRERTAVLSGVDEPLRLRLVEATPNLFEVWGTSPLRGRGFSEEEGEPGAQPVALITHSSWQRRFGNDPDIVGRTVKIDAIPTTIVGVLRSEIEFGDIGLAEIWVPLTTHPDEAPRTRRDLFVTGRLRADASVERANQQLAPINARLQAEFPEASGGWEIYSQSFHDGVADDSFWTILYLLAATVGLVMLIACSNVATMLLARGSVRARELAVRTALGAGRGRIVRQLLTESAVLSVTSGILGLALADASLRALTWLVGESGQSAGFFQMLKVDSNVLGFTLAVALAAPLLFALVPAVRAVRRNAVETLKEGAPGAGGRSAVRGRKVLVGVQVALALVLMVVAGLLIEAMIRARAIDLGYDTASVLTMRVDLPATRYPDPQSIRVFRDAVTERVQELPGVRHAAWIDRRSLADGGRVAGFLIEGEPEPLPEEVAWAFRTRVEPDYFSIVGVDAFAGRLLAEVDGAGSAPVAVLNREAAQRYWPDGDPVGSRIRLAGTDEPDSEGTWLEIIGVATNVVYPDPNQPSVPEVYLPFRQRYEPQAALIVGARQPMTLAAPIREAVWALDPEQPIGDVRTVARIHSDELASMNAVISMFSGFAIFALVMAAGGIYGVLSFSVEQRTREFGIRMALGAKGRAVRRMVVRHSAVLVLGGMAIGLAGAWLFGRLLAAGVPEVRADGPSVYATVALLLGAVAAVAIWIPALRATRVDPVTALRAE